MMYFVEQAEHESTVEELTELKNRLESIDKMPSTEMEQKKLKSQVQWICLILNGRRLFNYEEILRHQFYGIRYRNWSKDWRQWNLRLEWLFKANVMLFQKEMPCRKNWSPWFPR